MKNQLISLKKHSIYNKIKNFFYKVFHGNTMNNTDHNNKDIANNHIKKEDFINDIKANLDINEVIKKVKREEFVKELENNDKILDNLSLDKLKVIKKFYEDRVNRKKEILKKMKNNKN